MTDVERFYQLLPAIYRQHDGAAGEPLRALLAVLERELRTIEGDIEAAYDNWFVQTCDTWVLPYLADLVGIRTMSHQRHIFGTQRRMVANTIAYRRRKGALSVLEYTLRDVTGWHVRAVELYQQIAATPHLAAPGRHTATTVDLRNTLALEQAGGPFNQISHSVDVRAISPAADSRMQAGRYNLGNLALFIWRLRAYTMRDAAPYRLPPHGAAAPAFPRFALHPTGRPMQLFNQPQLVGDIAGRLTARNLPLALRRAELAADLDEYAASYADKRPEDRPVSSRFYGPDRGLQITLVWPSGMHEPLPPLEVACANLTGITQPYLAELRDQNKRVVIDPLIGQIALLPTPQSSTPQVRATYSYGFSAEIGGGPYHRRTSQASSDRTTLIAVARGTSTPTLREALKVWNDHCDACRKENIEPRGIIRLLDNARHGDDGQGDLVAMLPAGAVLTIAADNGVQPAIGPGCRLVVRAARQETQTDLPPALARLNALINTAEANDIRVRQLRLDGLLIDGQLLVEGGEPPDQVAGRVELMVEHCTILGGMLLHLLAGHAQLSIRSSIVGPLRAPAGLAEIAVSDSIIDGAPDWADKAPALSGISGPAGAAGPPLTLERVTVFGDLLAQSLAARDSIIVSTIAPQAQPTGMRDHTLIVAPSAAATLFTTTLYGQPGYAQLRADSPNTCRRGAADGSQQGVFSSLYHAQAEDNLMPVLDEYLPVGLEFGFIFVT